MHGSSSSPSLSRRTKYACEGSTLRLACDEGAAIDLVRANYGRLSLGICNEFERSNFSVNCLQPRTMRIVKSR